MEENSLTGSSEGAEACVGQRNSEMLSNVQTRSCGPKAVDQNDGAEKTVLPCLKKKLAHKIK